MEKLLLKQHSIADWNYRVGAKLELAVDQFISAPSSLRTQSFDAPSRHEHIYLGDALGLDIPEGRIVTYFRSALPIAPFLTFLFRCQDITYLEHPQDCYFINITEDIALLYCREAGVDTLLKTSDPYTTLVSEQWYKFRLTFYQYVEADFNIYLRIILEIEEDSAWKELLTYADIPNKWVDSGTNRIGFVLITYADPYYQWIDETQVWRKT